MASSEREREFTSAKNYTRRYMLASKTACHSRANTLSTFANRSGEKKNEQGGCIERVLV